MSLSSIMLDISRSKREATRADKKKNEIRLPNGQVLRGLEAAEYVAQYGSGQTNFERAKEMQELKNSGALNIQKSRNTGLAGVAGIRADASRDVAGIQADSASKVAGIRNTGLLGAKRIDADALLESRKLQNQGNLDVTEIQQDAENQRAVLKAGANQGKWDHILVEGADGQQPYLYNTGIGPASLSSVGGGGGLTSVAPGGIQSGGGFDANEYISSLMKGSSKLTGKAGRAVSLADAPAPFSATGSLAVGGPSFVSPNPVSLNSIGATETPSVVDQHAANIKGRLAMSGLGAKGTYQPTIKPVIDLPGLAKGINDKFFKQGRKALNHSLATLRNY